MAKRSAPIGGIEVRVVKDDEKTHNVVVQHGYMLSTVAQYAMELFRHALTEMEPVALSSGDAGYQRYQHTTIELSVQRACDGAEQMFIEMQRRRWLTASPPLSEIIESRDGGVPFGMHGRAVK